MTLAARPTPVIETPRLILRPRRIDDAEVLFPSLSDPDLMTYWSGPPHASVAETRADFERHSGDWRAWAVTLRGDDTAIGMVGAGEKRQGNVSELGYLFARAQWGTGVAREAVSAVIDRIFAEGQRKVIADTDPDNHASRRLLARLNFREEGYLRAEWETHLGVRDTVLYGLLRDEWRAVSAPPPDASAVASTS